MAGLLDILANLGTIQVITCQYPVDLIVLLLGSFGGGLG